MRHPALHTRLPYRLTATFCAAVAMASAFAGCKNEQAPKNKALLVHYETLPPKENVPSFMKGTIWELTDRGNDEGYVAATYGLVGRLRGTGDCTVSLQIREWMFKQMVRHGYGNQLIPGYENVGAAEILRNPGYSIVRVDGIIPPGARKGDFFDVAVSALPGNKTTSLSGGLLFESDLTSVRGNSPDLESIHSLAKAKGPIVVNPAYALTDVPEAGGASAGAAKNSLRAGTIMDGGLVMNDWPIMFRVRQPSRSNARAIEMRINQRFQHVADRARKNTIPITYQSAAALDEALIEIYVPRSYQRDWEHYIGVCEQLYLNASPSNLVEKAKELTEEAQKPGAGLLEISYGLEGIGEPALQYVLPLMASSTPDVAYAMARAAIFIGDPSGAAQDALVRIARNDTHPFQLAAIQTLGSLKSSAERSQKLRELLDSKNTLARTEAYKVLARSTDNGIYTQVIKEKFAIDFVQGGGDPLVFAARSGLPRFALLGPKAQVTLPILFTAMNGRLMISSEKDSNYVTLFYRDDSSTESTRMLSRPDVGEIIARLGGEGAREEKKFDFTYGEVVAVMQSLHDQHKIAAVVAGGKRKAAPFILEHPRQHGLDDSTPVIEDTRPNTGAGSVRGDEPVAPIGKPLAATK